MRAVMVGIVGLAGALVVMPGVAAAQDGKPVSFGVMGGLSLPMGNLGDAYDSGYNITGNVYLMPAGKRFSLRGDVGYESFGGQSIGTVASSDFSVLSVTGNILFPLGSNSSEGSMRPYLIGGAGIYRGSSDITITGLGSESVSSTDLGIAVGGGIEFKLSGFTTFAEARFTNVFSDGDSSTWIPLTFGIRF
jgi:hypothetical protein